MSTSLRPPERPAFRWGDLFAPQVNGKEHRILSTVEQVAVIETVHPSPAEPDVDVSHLPHDESIPFVDPSTFLLKPKSVRRRLGELLPRTDVTT